MNRVVVESWGSSPLTRGKLTVFHCLDRCHGLIPAHAGKTTARAAGLVLCRAHPRSRGENLFPCFLYLPFTGSSPLTRGKPVSLTDRVRNLGLIPAHAGKTFPLPSFAFSFRAHPRSRGENGGEGGYYTRRGLIPAHAGKTCCVPLLSGGAAAHPRSRGENISSCA